ncbi:MAG TPA: hypothetical protein PLO70_04455 [Chitinophagaceae bacterium]|jgi:hypothetical protein|nr:hypothetical protein [Chitinophagaceae bacterium]
MPNLKSSYQIALTKNIIKPSLLKTDLGDYHSCHAPFLGVENKKGEGRFSFTFLRRDISPATH